MKGIGSMIEPMGEADSYMLMEISIKANGKMIKHTEREFTLK
jgi:hypothetical protein